MDALTEIVKCYYERESEEEKKSIKELLGTLDVNGDGKISLQEFKNSMGIEWEQDFEKSFKKFDTSGDGNLDLDEFLCLWYRVKERVRICICDGCEDLLVGPYFSCLLCIGRGGVGSYDLCCSCYRRADLLSHEHSSDNMVDRYALHMLLIDRTAAAEKSHNKKQMEEVREIAKAHYRAGSPQVQELAHKFFRSLDTDGDGRVDLSEFLAFMRHEGYSYMQNPYFFKELDVDGNGTLEFFEVMTLYYIFKSGRPFCDSCGKFIPGIFFSCVECFNKPNNSFDLCGDCYRSAKCTHNHGGRALFLDNYTLLRALTRDADNKWSFALSALDFAVQNYCTIM